MSPTIPCSFAPLSPDSQIESLLANRNAATLLTYEQYARVVRGEIDRDRVAALIGECG